MSNFSKLYSYYFTNLFRKNWLKLTIFILLASVGAWFLGPFGTFYIGRKAAPGFWKDLLGETSYTEFSRAALNSDEVKSFYETDREAGLRTEEMAFEAWKEARKKGDQAEIKSIEEFLLKITRVRRIGGSTYITPLPPVQELEYNELSLGVEPSKNVGRHRWGSINRLSFWALVSGASFSWLTLSLVDFLFLNPKREGEEAMVLNFTPGVQRSDLLISKILVFLTYYSLFGLVTFVLPGLFYWAWVGTLAPSNLILLFLYTLFITPLLAFGLVILPYLLISDWSPLLGTLLSYLFFTLPLLYFVLLWNTPWAVVIHDLFFNPLIFVPLALGVGSVCLFLYYSRCQTQDLKT